MEFLKELYYLKKSVLMLENIGNGISKINSLFSDFRTDNPNSLTEEQLVYQVNAFRNILDRHIPIMIKEEWYFADYNVYTDKFHHRKFWNEIENDSSVDYFLNAFVQIKKIGDSELPYMLLLYDFNDEALYFESEKKAKEFTLKYDCAPCTLFKQYSNHCEEIWSV